VIKPEVLDLCHTPEEVPALIAKIEQVMGVLSGVSAVNRGEVPENLKSGSALAFVAAQAVTFSSGLQQSYNELLEGVGTTIIEILKDFAATPRLAVIAGSFDRPLMKEFQGKDLAQIDRVVVDATSAMSKTTAGKIQIAQDLLQSNLIRNAREYIAVVNTGELDTLYESEMSEIILVKSENEDLRSGQVRCTALVIDDHKFHVLSIGPSSVTPTRAVTRSWLQHGARAHPRAHQHGAPAPAVEPGAPRDHRRAAAPDAGPAGAAAGARRGTWSWRASPAASPGAEPRRGAQNARPTNMPNLPKGADQNTAAAYEQMKAAS
jgi:hypothetical protein